MSKLDLSRIRRAETHFERTFDPSEMTMEGDAYRIVAPVELVFDIHKDKDRFRLEGTLKTTLELPCSRCLEPFEMPIDIEFDQRYLPQTDATSEVEAEVPEDDLETSYYRGEEIDLSDLVREQFYLALPMKPLCRDDCEGLCPHCGTNLNTGTCDCAAGWEDPRLAPLKKLKTIYDS
ncbi:MAG TPA: DUF177 domain-containing protein [Vicinamibacterales bacterium]|jgi:uncharacterized protein|nr:DUF177 domain-containing protein [Vicinamibacterales bacterium]